MDEFKELLILVYLNAFKDEYLLSEIKELCNFSTKQMKKCLHNMVEKDLINDKFGRLLLTTKAESYLEEKGLIKVSIMDLFQDTVTLKFTDKPFSFEDIYIPPNFKI